MFSDVFCTVFKLANIINKLQCLIVCVCVYLFFIIIILISNE